MMFRFQLVSVNGKRHVEERFFREYDTHEEAVQFKNDFLSGKKGYRWEIEAWNEIEDEE